MINDSVIDMERMSMVKMTSTDVKISRTALHDMNEAMFRWAVSARHEQDLENYEALRQETH